MNETRGVIFKCALQLFGCPCHGIGIWKRGKNLPKLSYFRDKSGFRIERIRNSIQHFRSMKNYTCMKGTRVYLVVSGLRRDCVIALRRFCGKQMMPRAAKC